MPAASISNATIARIAQLLGFAFVAVALAIVSWRGTSLNLPGVGQFAGIIGSGFLGGIINPLMKSLTGEDIAVVLTDAAGMTRTAEVAEDRAAKALGAKSDMVWEIAVGIGAISIVVAALALAINGDQHSNAAPVLTALTTAFGALFVDTTNILHTADPTPVLSQLAAPVPVPSQVPVPVQAPVPAPAPAPKSEPAPAPAPKSEPAPAPEPSKSPNTETGQDT